MEELILTALDEILKMLKEIKKELDDIKSGFVKD